MVASSNPISDKTVIKNLGFCGFGMSSNTSAVDVKDGRIVRIRPLHYDDNYTREELKMWSLEKDGQVFDPKMKSLIPPLSLAYKMRTYSPNRVPYPLIRVDWDPNGERNPQNRGESKYRRISWDEATKIIADEIKRIHETYGPYSVYCQGEGHGESKTYNGTHGNQIALLNLVGECTVQSRQPDSWEGWVWGAKHVWGMEPLGQNKYQNGVFRDITENGDAVLFWGADPETTPWGWGGQLPSRMCYWFNDIGVKSIFICPDVNYASAVHADKWIPVLPNTDAALQLAIAHVWFSEGLYEKEYLESHAIGYDWFESYVKGFIDGIEKTPKWAEAKCGVKSYHIKALARYWAKHNVSIAHCNGGGMVRSPFSHEPARLEVCLLGMQAVGKPGCHQFKFIEWQLFGFDSCSPVPRSETYTLLMAAYHGVHGDGLGSSFLVKTKLPEAILTKEKVEWMSHGPCAFPAEDQFIPFEFPMNGGKGIHMIWSDAPCWSTCWNGGFKMEDALRDDSIEFVLVQHPWMENDTVFADIILPSATGLELSDIANDNMSGQVTLLYLEDQAVELQGEAISDYEVVCEVAKALEKHGGIYENLYNRYVGDLSKEEVIRKGFETSGVPADFTYDDLKEKKFWASKVRDGWESEPAGLYNFYMEPEKYPLETPSGKLEYYSTRLAEHFPDDKIRGPYPQWIEEGDGHQERIGSKRAEDYPYLLVSNHPRWRVHAQHDDIPWLREIETCKVVGPDGYAYEPLWINPLDAKKHGIEDGDIVSIYNERGSVLGGARITERVMPGALYQDHGAHIDAIKAGTGGLDRGGANNLICPSPTSSKNAPGEVTNGFLVGVEKADVFELARQYPEQFNREYSSEVGLIADAYIEKGV